MSDLVMIAALVGLVAGLAQAVTGFGSALVAIPLLALATDAQTAVVGMTMLSTVFTLVAGVHQRGHVDWRTMRLVSIAGVVGMPLGLLALHVASEPALKILIAAVVLISVPLLARGIRLAPRTSSTLVAGALSGAMLTSTGMNGPPLVAAFQAMELSPRAFRATLQATFCVQDVLAVAGFLAIGQLTSNSLIVAAAGIPGAVLGWFLGDRVFRRTPAHVFRYLVLGLMVVTGLAALIQAVNS